jgi:hypothetical protein
MAFYRESVQKPVSILKIWYISRWFEAKAETIFRNKTTIQPIDLQPSTNPQLFNIHFHYLFLIPPACLYKIFGSIFVPVTLPYK